MLGDGLVTFTGGDGSRDILLLCGAIPATYGDALTLFDLLRQPLEEGASMGGVLHQTFDLMLAEVTNPGLGTQAMAELLMKQCLLALLRHRMRENTAAAPLHAALREPRLGRAVLAVIEDPAAPHTVESLADLAGMSRASFAAHFARALQQGPIEFVQSNRLRVGARLLATTDLPIKVIAQSSGYSGANAVLARIPGGSRHGPYHLPQPGSSRGTQFGAAFLARTHSRPHPDRARSRLGV